MSEEIKTSHFKTMKELLEHLKMWERDDDYEAYCRFFDYECAYTMAHYIDRLQKENDTLKITVNKQSKDISEQLQELDKKDKVIDLMAEVIEECRQNDVIEFNENIDLSEIAGENRIKEYFYKKAEELGWNE